MSDLRFHKWTYPVAVALFGLHIAVGQAEPVKYALKRSGPESICQWSRHYVPLLPLPWCPPPGHNGLLKGGRAPVALSCARDRTCAA